MARSLLAEAEGTIDDLSAVGDVESIGNVVEAADRALSVERAVGGLRGRWSEKWYGNETDARQHPGPHWRASWSVIVLLTWHAVSLALS
jgi:hypothetical protein